MKLQKLYSLTIFHYFIHAWGYISQEYHGHENYIDLAVHVSLAKLIIFRKNHSKVYGSNISWEIDQDIQSTSFIGRSYNQYWQKDC